VSLDRFEQEKGEFFERVRQAYLARAAKSPQRIAVIHAEKSLSEVQQELSKIVASL
jgi:dTMP kinase